MKKNGINNNNLIPVISFCQINKSFTVDYLKENDINNINTKNNVIKKSKLISISFLIKFSQKKFR